ncbi:MAG TPA: hypothetical protein DD473_15960 [Planctomycetaceae bacterium]|nr:hypothetical protein [Planctomycetaceae bacterium]
MTQRDLDSAVAIATGEDLREIQRRGFSVADPFEMDFDPEPNDLPPNVIEWDELELLRTIAFF